VRELKFFQAINEAMDLSMAADPAVYTIGLGVPDPKSIFGSTKGLLEKYGPERVLDMPASENGMTGVAIGSALVGMKPVMTHQRLDFALLSLDQIVNQAAKWHYMFGGQQNVPLVIRMIVGRGWGQGPQHSQSLQSWFAHIPGLKVVVPATPDDAKGLLISSIEDGNPVIFLEHRWLYNTFGPVPEGMYRTPLGRARVRRTGSDVTIVGVSYAVLESLRAAEILTDLGVDAEVIDVCTVSPLDCETLLASVRKTGRLLVADTGWSSCGVTAEVIASMAERGYGMLKAAPRRVTPPPCPTPTTPALSRYFYPGPHELAMAVCEMLEVPTDSLAAAPLDLPRTPPDIPDPSFTGPF